jgi:hypothetical protein
MAIDHQNPGNRKIYMTCNASKRWTGAVLSFGETWETSRPVAFESQQLKRPELHYPVHEQEMLSIMRALAKWHTDLLGSHVNIFTDHKTLQNFDSQHDLSLQQARWMEYLSHYKYLIYYIKEEDNTVADALSWLPLEDDSKEGDILDMAAAFTIENDPELLTNICNGYTEDSWCRRILEDLK